MGYVKNIDTKVVFTLIFWKIILLEHIYSSEIFIGRSTSETLFLIKFEATFEEKFSVKEIKSVLEILCFAKTFVWL